MLNTILFDLDGTLAPFMQDDFIRAYFGALVKRLAPMGYEKDALIAALWKGTAAMTRNDGRCLNQELFWNVFAQELGDEIRSSERILEEFYTREFDDVRSVLLSQVDRKPLVDMLRSKGYCVVLATNPLFPAIAIETRLRWIGLSPKDFDYVTTYENIGYSKPNPDYYRAILDQIGKEPEECLMLGNNPVDDMAALKAGIPAYLVTDCIENPDDLPIEEYRHGSFQDAEEFLASLPDLN